MVKGHRKCEICGIQEARRTDDKLNFFTFPLEPDRCQDWLKVCGNEDLVHLPIEKLHVNRFVCSNHFDKKDFNKKGNRLKRHAIPTLHLKVLPLNDSQLAGFPQHLYRQPKDVPVCVSPELNFDTPTIESDGKKKEQEKERNKQIKDSIDERIDTEEDRISSPCPIDAEQNFECWRYKLTNIVDSAKFCGFCAENDEGMLPVHEYLDIGVKELNLKKSWSEIVQEVFHNSLAASAAASLRVGQPSAAALDGARGSLLRSHSRP